MRRFLLVVCGSEAGRKTISVRCSEDDCPSVSAGTLISSVVIRYRWRMWVTGASNKMCQRDLTTGRCVIAIDILRAISHPQTPRWDPDPGWHSPREVLSNCVTSTPLRRNKFRVVRGNLVSFAVARGDPVPLTSTPYSLRLHFPNYAEPCDRIIGIRASLSLDPGFLAFEV